MEIPASIFREYDIRGVVGRDLTPARVEAIGRAIGSEARAQGLSRLAVARDGRLSGPELVQALRNGLRATGCAVLDVGMVPTPALYFAIHHLHADGGVMLTGSHNPPNYNGFKMVLGGRTLHGAAIQQIQVRIRADDFWAGPVGDVENEEILPAYVQRIVGDVHLARRLRIGMDCGSGVTGVVAPELFRALGCEVHGLFTEVDGHFPHHHPDPSEEKNLQDLIRLVEEQGLDLGLAFDGDGDRLGVVAPGGEIIWADRQMILFAQDVLSRVPGAPIIFDVKCSHFLPEAIRAAGGVPLMWKTGHSLIKAKMAELAAPLAGEMSGHIFFQERWYGFDDGLYAGARLLEILSKRTEVPGAVLRALPKGFSTPELRVELAEGEHFALMDQIRAGAAQGFPDATLITLDGVRVELADAWGLVRASNTQPVLVLRFEGDSAAALAAIQQRFRELLQAVKPGVTLPF